MEEYWNLFLNWLGYVGRQNDQDEVARMLLPRAQRAEDRYANSYRFNGHEAAGLLGTEGVRQDYNGPSGPFMVGGDVMPAEIYRYVPYEGDTVYVEKPTRSDTKYGLIRRKSRKASTKN